MMKNITDFINEAEVTGDKFYVTQVWSQGDSYDFGEPRVWGYETEDEAKQRLNELFDGFATAAFKQYYLDETGFIAITNDRTMTTHFYEVRTLDELKKIYRSINRKKAIEKILP